MNPSSHPDGESYSLKYEGSVLAASSDGTVMRIGRPQGGDVHPGDVVAVLNGPGAGQWRRVLHVLDPSTYLIDKALPKDAEAVSICQGFVTEVFEGNRIDLRGGRRSDAFVLPGNHFPGREWSAISLSVAGWAGESSPTRPRIPGSGAGRT